MTGWRAGGRGSGGQRWTRSLAAMEAGVAHMTGWRAGGRGSGGQRWTRSLAAMEAGMGGERVAMEA